MINLHIMVVMASDDGGGDEMRPLNVGVVKGAAPHGGGGTPPLHLHNTHARLHMCAHAKRSKEKQNAKHIKQIKHTIQHTIYIQSTYTKHTERV